MIEQETLLSKYRRNQSATYTTLQRQCDKETISCKDNKAYKLASPNNSERGNNSRGETIMEYTKTIA